MISFITYPLVILFLLIRKFAMIIDEKRELPFKDNKYLKKSLLMFLTFSLVYLFKVQLFFQGTLLVENLNINELTFNLYLLLSLCVLFLSSLYHNDLYEDIKDFKSSFSVMIASMPIREKFIDLLF